MKLPLFIATCKNYEIGVGSSVRDFAAEASEVAETTGKSIALAVNPIDLQITAQSTDLPIVAQHIDAIGYGSHTGWIHGAAVKEAGVHITLLNHSEHRLPSDQIEAHVKAAFENGLEVILCAESAEEVEKFASLYKTLAPSSQLLAPNFAIAYEPPELIGSADKSVSSENPDIIKKSVEIAGDIPLIVGAGVNSSEDIRVAIELGAQGFLVASAICKAKDPKAKLEELVTHL